MSWAAVIAGAGAVIGGVVSSQGAKKAAGTAAAGSDAAAAEAARQFDITRGDSLGRINIGNQAVNALGRIYGYSPTVGSPYQANTSAGAPQSYTPPAIKPAGGFFNTGAGAAVNPWTVTSKLGGAGKILDPAGGLIGNIFGGGGGSHKRNWDAFNSAFPGTTVDAQGNYKLPAQFGGATINQSQLDNLAGTWYGATYAPDGNQQGWQQQFTSLASQIAPNVGQQAPAGNAGGGLTSDGVPNTTPFQTGQTGAPGAIGSNPLAAPDYSAFFQSPDYQFRKDQGMQGIGNSFSAIGGAKSGNALKALAEFNSNLAAGSFGDYFNRQAALAGIGQTASSQSSNAGVATGQIVGNALQNSADARASGVAGQYNAIGQGLSGLEQGLGYYMQQRQNPYGNPYSGQGPNSYYNWNFPG